LQAQFYSFWDTVYDRESREKKDKGVLEMGLHELCKSVQGLIMYINARYLRTSLCLAIIFLSLFFIQIASADSPPSIPNVFEGRVLAGGIDAPIGTVVSAYIDSKLVGWNPITEAGKYKIGISGTEQDNGKKIIFKLGLAESDPVSVVYQQGALPTQLDLSFKGDFIDPVIESFSVSPLYILNDGTDFSVISARVSDGVSGVSTVTIDLSAAGGELTSLKPEAEDIYSSNFSSNLAGEFKFPLKAIDFFGNKATTNDTVSITVLKEEELITRYGGTDSKFSAEEIRDLLNKKDVSEGIKYAVLAIYYDDGWDKI
jgi:hypothetical protein